MSLRALIFDVDGTLAETEEVHRRAFNETFAEVGLGWHWEVPEYMRLLTTTGGKERIARYRDEINSDLPADDHIAGLHLKKTARYAEILRQGDLDLRPGVGVLVDDARKAGLKIAVATTTSRSNVEALCETCWGVGADQIFDVVAAGDEVAKKKPSPDIYLLALSRLGLGPEQALAVEDSIPGLRAAQAAGLRCLVTPSIYTRHEDFTAANWVCPSLTRNALPEPVLRLIENRQ